MWPYTFWGRHKSRVFQYRILGRIFGYRREKLEEEDAKNCFRWSSIIHTHD
jgi:hypothetical protein